MAAEATVDVLLGFCEYLALRLHSENLELLQRVIREFHATPRAFTTIEALLATGFPAVAILPVDKEPLRAQAMLESGQGPPRRSVVNAMRELYDALGDKIELTNGRWLLRMYEDYCYAVETTVEAFVATRHAAIAMFPIAPLSKKLDDETATSRDETGDTMASVQETTTSSLSMDESSDEHDLAATLRRAQQLVERKAPWERIYDVARIEYPFDSAKYPGLALCLLTFWEKHARAVWERYFWPPLAECHDIPGSAYYLRKQRQYEASKDFTNNVIIPIFGMFGAQFFVDLDKQDVEFYWWWYRRPLVELMKMALAVGVDECVRYTTSQARKRVPRLPKYFQVHSRGMWYDHPVSMWSMAAKVQPIAAAIETLQKTREKKAKRRFELAP